MAGLDLALLGAAALATSALTATLGVGGGMILLSIMLLYWDPLTAIPLHGAIQLVSNASRATIQRRHVRWELIARYAILLVPAGLLGLAVSRSIPVAWARAAIGVFVLLAVWAPRAMLLGLRPEDAHPTRRFFWLGAAAGFGNTTVGATGPLQGPFFRNLGFTRHAVVGTFAAAQTLGHAVKIALFAASGFGFGPHAIPLVLLALCVLLGTWLGSRLLDRVDEASFGLLYRAALTVVALRLALWEPFFAS